MERTTPNPGYELCYECEGLRLCWVCAGYATVNDKLCGNCAGRRGCMICQGAGQLKARPKPRALVARSSAECRLYIARHPHACDESAFPVRARVDQRPEGLVAVYEGPCPRCGQARSFDFLLDPTLPPPEPAFGGAKPSQLIDAGQYLAHADRRAAGIPSVAELVDTAKLPEVRDRLAEAAAAIEEVLKFIAPDEARLGDGGIFTDEGTRVYGRQVRRFTRASLEGELATYRARVADADRELAKRARAEHYARGTKLAQDLVDAFNAPDDPAMLAKNEEHERMNEALLEVYYVRSGQQPPTARSVEEMRFAASLEPCPACKTREVGLLSVEGGGTSWKLDGPCPACGTMRSWTFTTKADPRQSVPEPYELGTGPSLLIRKETFEAELGRVSPAAATDAMAMTRALVCVNELLELTRPGTPEHDKLASQRTNLLAMQKLAQVLVRPGSTIARKALAAAWRAAGDSRATLIEQQLEYLEYVRKQVTWADEARALDRAITGATRDHGRAWAGTIADLVDGFAFHRGLVAEVTLRGDRFLAHGARLFELAPIQHLNLTAPVPVVELAASPLLAKLVSLKIDKLGAAFGDAGAIALARSPHVQNLRWLALRRDDIGQAGVEALAASPYLERVAYLDLEGNPKDPTPTVREYEEGVYLPTRPALALELERTFGARPWLSGPAVAGDWPPDRDALAITD